MKISFHNLTVGPNMVIQFKNGLEKFFFLILKFFVSWEISFFCLLVVDPVIAIRQIGLSHTWKKV
jgi:hypothetical protein